MHPAVNPQVTGLLLDAVGILILGVPAAFRMSREIQAQSGTYFGSNPHLAKALSESRVDIVVGSLILFAGFLAQLVGNVGYQFDYRFGWSLISATLAFALLYFFYLRAKLAGALYKHVMAALTAEERGG